MAMHEDDTPRQPDRVRAAPPVPEIASGALLGVAALLAIGWAWTLIRAHQHADRGLFVFDDGEDGVSFTERLDITFQSMFLLAYAAVVAGLAAVVRVIADRGGTP